MIRRRRTAECNSSVSTDDHEDDFLTLEIHQEHSEHHNTEHQQQPANIFCARAHWVIVG